MKLEQYAVIRSKMPILWVLSSRRGVCNECDGYVHVVSKENRNILLIQTTEGSNPHTFTKRRGLAKEKASSLISDLNSDTTHNVHMKLVNNLDDSLTRTPRDYVTHKSLKNLKYRNNSKNDSAITELRKMKYLPQYSSAIKEVCTDPLRIMFWTKEQIFCYNQLKRRQRMCLSFDATGGLISRASVLQDIQHEFDILPEIPHMFLYLLSVKKLEYYSPEDTSIPVGQMISAVQDSTAISYFLERWMSEFDIPHEMVCDDSAALQKSIVRSFTRFRSTAEYIDGCFMILEGKAVKMPECFLRLDVPHFISSIGASKIFRNIDKRLKHYYLCIMGVLISCESYIAVKNIIKNALILANYPVLGKELPTEEAHRNIDALIQTHEINFLETDEDKNNCEFEVENVEHIEWFDEMLKKIEEGAKATKNSKQHSKTANLNWYYLPQVNSFFRYHISRLPLWTALMKPHFESTFSMGISTETESRFQILKNNVFKKIRLPTRADVFVKTLLGEVNGVSKLGRLLCANLSTDTNNNQIGQSGTMTENEV